MRSGTVVSPMRSGRVLSRSGSGGKNVLSRKWEWQGNVLIRSGSATGSGSGGGGASSSGGGGGGMGGGGVGVVLFRSGVAVTEAWLGYSQAQARD